MSGEAEAREGRCSTCWEAIHPLARKCKTCDSYQDFRRYFQMGSTVLALLVALVSVAALSIPVVKEATAPRNSRIRLSFQGFADNRAFVLATNEGDRTGSISAVALTTKMEPGKRTRVEIPFVPEMLPPGAAKQLVIDLAGAPRRVLDQRGMVKLDEPVQHPFVFEFTYRDFASTRNQLAPVAADDLKGAFRSGGTAWHLCASQTVDFIERAPAWKSTIPTAAGDIAQCEDPPPYMDRLIATAKARDAVERE